MSSSDLIKGLKMCNRNVTVPEPAHYESMGWHYPGMKDGQTSIWLGRPPTREDAASVDITLQMHQRRKRTHGRKVCAFHLGWVPEWTQLSPEGTVIRRGVRDILERFIKAGGASRQRVERIFKTYLDYDGDDGSCVKCRRRGKRVPYTSSHTKLCDFCGAVETALRNPPPREVFYANS